LPVGRPPGENYTFVRSGIQVRLTARTHIHDVKTAKLQNRNPFRFPLFLSKTPGQPGQPFGQLVRNSRFSARP